MMEGHRMAKRLTIYQEKYKGLQAEIPADDVKKVRPKWRHYKQLTII